MKLYGVPGSPFVRKALVALEEKGLPYELERLVSLPHTKTAEHLALHPMGKIPDSARRRGRGARLVRDLRLSREEASRRPRSIRTTLPSFAKALFLEEYADTRMFEVLGPVLFERVVKRFVFQQEPDEARVAEQLTNALPPVLDYLESQLPGDRDTVLARFTIADAALGAQLATLALSGVEIDARRWPRTASYYRDVMARPSFKTAMAR